MKIYFDNFGNKAEIEKVKILPYNGADKKVNGYRLTLSAMYDDDFVYHVSVHESLAEAENKMRTFSCKEWEEK